MNSPVMTALLREKGSALPTIGGRDSDKMVKQDAPE
jgi:hypothetical protein